MKIQWQVTGNSFLFSSFPCTWAPATMWALRSPPVPITVDTNGVTCPGFGAATASCQSCPNL